MEEGAGDRASRILSGNLRALIVHQLELALIVRDMLGSDVTVERVDEITGTFIDAVWRATDLDDQKESGLAKSLELYRSKFTNRED